MIFRPNAPFTPPTDVLEFPDKLLVFIEIAGMRPSDFTITLLNNQLVVAGVRERPSYQGAAYHQVEIGYGDFRVEVTLPWPVEQDKVEAVYRDGFLQIELPRRPEKAIRIINVNAETDEAEND